MGPWYILASEKECIIDPGDPGCYHYSDVMMNVIPFQISGVSIVQAFVPAQIKRNIKAPRHWFCEGNSPHKGPQLRGKGVHLMTSSW